MKKFRIDDQLELRTHVLGDAPSLFQLVDANRTYLREWLPWLDANTSIADSKSFIELTLKQASEHEGFTCGIYDKGALIGCCGYHDMNKQTQTVMIGYWLAESAMGTGVVSRSVSFLTEYAFRELGLTEVGLSIAEGNIPSEAIAARLGFLRRCKRPKAENLYGHVVDHYYYSVRRDDGVAP